MMRPLPPLAALFAVLALAGVASAQEDEGPISPRERKLLEGTEVVRRIFHDHDFQALESFDDLGNQDPERTLLVVFGDLDALARVPDGLETFVRKGGALLAAGDRALDNAQARMQLVAVSGVWINRERLICDDEQFCYKGRGYCPRILPVAGGALKLFERAGANLAVFSNVPSKLVRTTRHLPGQVRPVAVLPLNSIMELPGGNLGVNPGQFGGQYPLFGVAGEVGDGRIVVLADHSIFINEMMVPHDTNNVEFTYNLVEYLRGERGQRNRVLFVEEGQIQTRLDLPLQNIPLSPEHALQYLFARRNELLGQAQNVLTRLEDEDAFNQKLLQVLDRMGLPPEQLLRLVLILGTIVLAFFLIYRVGIRGRFRPDTAIPLLAQSVGRNLPAVSLAEQRHLALVKSQNLLEPASALVNRWFTHLGVDNAPNGHSPEFLAQGGWWQRRRRIARLRQLWRLGQGRSPARISPSKLAGLKRELETLRVAWERGAWSARIEEPKRGQA